jgi:four helix bundle protein
VKENILKVKSYNFAVSIIKSCRVLSKLNKEYILTSQLLKSGTSIGANIREAEYAQSKKDFTSKMSIALKEANETGYWLELLKDTGFISEENYETLHDSLIDLIRLLIRTVKTSKGI